MESGEWRVESGEWRVESGEWRVESGEWRVESGERSLQSEASQVPELDFCLRPIPLLGVCSQATGTVVLVPVFTAF